MPSPSRAPTSRIALIGMLRGLLILACGIALMVYGIDLYLAPIIEGVERAGWLYRQIGAKGLLYGAVAFGALLMIFGGWHAKMRWDVLLAQRG